MPNNSELILTESQKETISPATVPDTFWKELGKVGKDKLQDFLAFCANYPELSVDNCAILYSQKVKPGNLVIRKDMLDYFPIVDIADSSWRHKPYTLNSICLNKDNEICYTQAPFFCMPKSSSQHYKFPSLAIYYACRRAGYQICLDDTVTGVVLDEKKQTVAIPSRWDDETRCDALVFFLVDLYWKRCLDQEIPTPISSERFRKYYRRVLVSMIKTYLGYSGVLISKPFYLYVMNAPTPSDTRGILSKVHSLFVDCLQNVVTGRWFTLDDAMIWHATNGQIYSHNIEINRDQYEQGIYGPMDSYTMMLYRYVDFLDEDIPFLSFHPYNEWAKHTTPFSIEKLRREAAEYRQPSDRFSSSHLVQ